MRRSCFPRLRSANLGAFFEFCPILFLSVPTSFFVTDNGYPCMSMDLHWGPIDSKDVLLSGDNDQAMVKAPRLSGC